MRFGNELYLLFKCKFCKPHITIAAESGLGTNLECDVGQNRNKWHFQTDIEAADQTPSAILMRYYNTLKYIWNQTMEGLIQLFYYNKILACNFSGFLQGNNNRTKSQASSLLLSKLTTLLELIDNTLNAIETHLKSLHLRTIRKADEMMTRTIKQITTLAWI
jgi:hypothetical protein